MEDTLKTMLWKSLRFLLARISAPESFPGMKARHTWEIEIFQNHCKHKEVSFRFPPHVVCADCEKWLRMATTDELKKKHDAFIKNLEGGINEVLAERGESIILKDSYNEDVAREEERRDREVSAELEAVENNKVKTRTFI